MASVVASVPSICLSLSKTVFRNALSEDSFAAVLSTVLAQRRKARKRRQTASKNRLVSGKPFTSLVYNAHKGILTYNTLLLECYREDECLPLTFTAIQEMNIFTSIA